MPERAPIRVAPVRKEGARWALRLSGAVNTVLEYDGRKVGREVVRLGDVVVAQASTFHGYNRRFELEVATTAGTLPLVLEVRVSLWAAIESVTLRLQGRTIYYEQTYHAVEPSRPALPIPLEAPVIPFETLPRPLSAPPLDVTRLPRALAASPASFTAHPPEFSLPRHIARAVAALFALAGGFLG